jgi:hypothetical protein
VNVRMVADPAGRLLWISPALRGPCPRPDHGPRIPRSRPAGDDTPQTPAGPRPRPGPGSGQASRRRGHRWSGTRPESNDVDRRSRPHPGAATLKELTGSGIPARAGPTPPRVGSRRRSR